MLSIRLFGPPEVFRDDAPLNIARRKSRALLYYVAAHARPRTREHLLAFFWPDAERAAGQQALRTTLHGLRKALGDALVVTDDAVALAPDVQVDARTVEAQLSPPAPDLTMLEAALALYRGEFLADFSLSGNAEFDEWAALERERYRRLYARGLLALSAQHEAQQAYTAALDALERVLQTDPLQEDVQRRALRLQYAMGDRAGAIRRYERFRELLGEVMGVPPMAETRALYDAIITDKVVPSTSPSARRQTAPAPTASGILPFTGRKAELQALREAAASQRLALIEGEPGIGKTRLAEEFIRGAHMLALVGRARELESVLPYQPIVEALRGLLADPAWPAMRSALQLLPVWQAEFARLVPEFASARDDSRAASDELAPLSLTTQDESRLWEGVFQFLSVLAHQQPLILFLDDLHWADSSTLALFGYLLRQAQAARARLAFVATTRPVSPRSPLATLRQSLLRDGRLVHLVLARLAPEDTSGLAQRLSPAHADTLAKWLLSASEGNPYILSELVREARAQHILDADGTLHLQTLPDAPVVPANVYSLIQGRLARLSDDARRVLDVAVAAGRVFEFELVARAAGLSENAVLDALDELRAAALIEPVDAARFRFDHTLTMEVAYREAGEPRHRLFHRRIAEAMEHIYQERIDSVAGLLAWHFVEGSAPERAAPYAFRAGQLAARLPAWQEAITFFEQALAGETRGARRYEILMALGEACAQRGDSVRASEAFRDALALAEAGDDLTNINEARLALGRTLLQQARFSEVIALAQQVIASDHATQAISAEFTWGAALSIEGADLAGAAAHLQRALNLSQSHVDVVRTAQIKFELGGVQAQQGNLQAAVQLYRETLAAAEQAPATALTWRILALNNLAYHLMLLGDESAQSLAQQGFALAQETGSLFTQPFLLSTLGEIALAHDRFDEAQARFADGLALAERLAMPERVVGLTANLGLVALRRGEATRAIYHLSTAMARADALGLQQLAAQVRLWLVPLLPRGEAQARLAEARAIAERGHRRRLLAEVERLANLPAEK